MKATVMTGKVDVSQAMQKAAYEQLQQSNTRRRVHRSKKQYTRKGGKNKVRF